MKKLKLFIVLLAFSGFAFGQNTTQDGRCVIENLMQTQLTQIGDEIGDFTITDSDGVTHNLYESLDAGKTVFIDLFFSTWSSCAANASLIEEVYVNSGSGQEDILLWGISPSDNNAQIDAYCAQYGIQNPCAGTEGGGPAAINVVNSGQPFIGYPTYIVVCPDQTVFYDVCWPPALTCFDPFFEECNPSQVSAFFESDLDQVCEGAEVSFSDQSTGTISSWNWIFEGGTPSSSSEQNPSVTYETPGEYDVELTVSDGTNSNTLTAADFMLINALPTLSLENFGEVCFEWEPFELSGGLPEGGEYSGIGVSDGMFDPALAGMGTHLITYTYEDANECVNFIEAEIIVTSCVGIEDTESAGVKIYPNPSDGIFTISMETNRNLPIEVFNATGQSLIKGQVNNSGTIDLSNQVNGIYYLRIKMAEKPQIYKLILNKD